MKYVVRLLFTVALLVTVTIGGSAQMKVMDAETIGKYGGELRHAALSDPKTFNPFLATEDSSTGLLYPYLFEGLAGRNYTTGEVEARLAREWSFSEDGRVWTFYLREGVHWHDGVPFTADDVIFSFDLVYDDNVPNSFRDSLMVKGEPLTYRKVDAYTVEFTMPEPFPPLLASIDVPIVPKHILSEAWEEGRFREMWGIDTPPEQIIGTGPFRMVEYRPNQYNVFERNSNYWRVDALGNRLPYLDRFVRHLVGQQDGQRLMFQNGDIHTYYLNSDEVHDFETNAARGNYTVYEGGPTLATLFTVFNQNELHVPEPKINWFQNLNFRRAIAHATDKQSIIDIVYGGAAEDLFGPVSTTNRAFVNENVRRYEYDLDKAAQLLAEAGFVKGRDGLLRDWDGNVVEFELTTNDGNLERETLAALLAEDLTELGMIVHYNTIAFNALVNQLTSGPGWDAIVIGLPSVFDPHEEINVWRHDGNLHIWNVGRDGPQTEWEARVDELFDLAATELDPVKRYEYYAEWQAIIADEVPLIYAVARGTFAAMRNDVQNVEYTSAGGLFQNIHTLWIAD